MKLSSLATGPRVIASFVLVLTVMALMTSIALWRLQAANDMTEYLVHDKLAKQQIASDLLGAVDLNGIRALSIAKSDSLEVAEYFQGQLTSGEKLADTLENNLRALPGNAAEKTMLAAVEQQGKSYRIVRDEVFRLKDGGKTIEVEQLVGTRMESSFKAYLLAIRTLLDSQKDQATALALESVELYRTSRTMLIGLGVLAMILGGLLAWLLTRSIVVPLKQAVDFATRVARGDLRATMATRRKDEIGQLLIALGSMNAGLAGTVGEVRDGVDAIATASREIAVGNGDLSRRTESQAGTLEETASALEELTAAVKQNAANAEQANALAASAAGTAARGGADIQRVASIMAAIKKSSTEIADIIVVMDSIAFQTNILALNAAVEAARSGEHGRGFAVVAGEVRTLAQRSSTAAREIKTLIAQSVEQVAVGENFVKTAAGTMDEIVASSRSVSGIVDAITLASREQSTGIEQVNQAMFEIDETTQQNAALVEQAAAATASLREQANRLNGAMAFFTIEDTAAPAIDGMVTNLVSGPRLLAGSTPAVQATLKTAAREIRIAA